MTRIETASSFRAARVSWHGNLSLLAMPLVLGLALASACKSEQEPTLEQTPESAPMAEPAATAAPAPKEAQPELAEDEPRTRVDGIPTPEDFEQEAQERVNGDNLEAELDRLEREIESE